MKLDAIYLNKIVRDQAEREAVFPAIPSSGRDAPLPAAIIAAQALEFLPEEHSCQLNDSQAKSLLEHARQTIRDFLNNETAPSPPEFDPVLENRHGAFVTLRKSGELRGCIGHIGEDKPLREVVAAMALQSAFNDPRFKPLAAEELPEIKIEISVLTSYHKINDPQEIIPGRHGVLLKKNGRQAVFLPQVAAERKWNCEQLLDHLCIKAGLKPGSWKKNADLFIFRALVLGES